MMIMDQSGAQRLKDNEMILSNERWMFRFTR